MERIRKDYAPEIILVEPSGVGKLSGIARLCKMCIRDRSKGIASVSLQSGVPVMFGVLTTENIEQAIERAGTKAGNKGFDCAVSAIEMVNLLRAMD